MKRIDNYYISFQSLIICTLPFFLATGPFIPDLIISLSSLFFLIYSIYKKNFYYFKNKFLLFFLFWYFYILLTSLLSNHIIHSLESTLFYFRFGIFSCCVYFIIKENKKFLKFFFNSLLITFLFILLDAYIQYFYGKNILGYEYDGIRLGGITGDELILGSFISRLFPLMFGLAILFFKKNLQIYFIFLLLILADVIIFLSGERSAFFYLLLFTFLLIILSSQNRYLRITSFIISLAAIILISSLDSNKKFRMFGLTLQEISGTNNEVDSINMVNLLGNKFYVFSKYHTAHFRSAYEMFSDNQIIGVGPKNYRIVCDYEKYKNPWSCATHAHNTYMQLLSETGIIGFLIIFSLFIFVSIIFLDRLTFNLFSKYKLDTYFICLLISVYISLWPFVPTGSFFNNWLNIIYFLPVGFILAHLDNKVYSN